MIKPENQPTFIFEAVGTRGDIAPLLGLAEQMVRRGHACRVIGPLVFAGDAAAIGAEFRANTARHLSFSPAESMKFENYFYPGLDQVTLHFRELAERRASAVVVNIDKTCASNLLAEKYGFPTVRLHLSPFKIRSLVSPPWPLRQRAQGPLGAAFLKHTLPQLLEKADRDQRLVAYVNGRRLALGLPATDSVAAPASHVRRELGLFPRWFCEPAPDWPSDLELVGFPLPRTREPLDASLHRFLEGQGKPIVFTTGTGVAAVDDFFEHARACCEELGMRGVFLSPHLSRRDFGPRILCVDYAELGLLLPHAALFVHHGGIGGTARALEAGVPQIVSPLGYDQPDNAHRVLELGVGRIVERNVLSGARLAESARELMQSPTCSAALCSWKRASAKGSALERAAAILEGQMSAGRATITPACDRPLASPARTVLFVVWPEVGHITAPLTLARQLRSRGDQVVFAGLGLIRDHVLASGFEFFELASLARSSSGAPCSILWSWSGERALGDAALELRRRFHELVVGRAPSLVLIDSLYSILGLLAEAEGLRWALYETDLPRELDPSVPPPSCPIVPTGTVENRRALRQAWAQLLRQTARSRASHRPRGAGSWSMSTGFPDALVSELRGVLGEQRVALRRCTAAAPVARAQRLIFCPRPFDFERSRTDGLVWVDAGVDVDRAEPGFPWERLPSNRPLVYCSLGTQAVRTPRAARVLQTVVAAMTELPQLFLVLVCCRIHQTQLGPLPPNCWVVDSAPQLGLIRRASVVITHGGFNTIKECVSSGVPMVVIPLSHDQPRNAALVEYHGVGVSLGAEAPGAGELGSAIRRVHESETMRGNCQRLATHFQAERERRSALQAIDQLLDGAPSSVAAPALPARIPRPTEYSGLAAS